MTLIEGARTMCTYTPTQSITMFQAPPLQGGVSINDPGESHSDHMTVT